MGGGDEFWSWAGAKAGEMAGVVPGGDNLQDAETVFAFGGEGKRAAGDHANLDIIEIVDLATSGKELIKSGRPVSQHLMIASPCLPAET